MRWYGRFMVYDGKVQWCEGIESLSPAWTDLVNANHWLALEIQDAMYNGVVVGTA